MKEKYSPQVAADFLDALDFAMNIVKATPFYYWNLIQDADDNKFSDCAISAGADYLVVPQKALHAVISLGFILKAVDKNLQESVGKSKKSGRFDT